MTIAWLNWDPNRFVFTIPLIDRPVAWYGIFFVLGFMIGYFIMIRLLQTTLRHTQYIAERDVRSWPLLLRLFSEGPKPNIPEQKTILTYFSESTKTTLQKIGEQKNPSYSDRNTIIAGLNAALSDPHNAITRENIDSFFPQAIFSLKELAIYLTDRLTWFVMLGTIIGARLGHVFLYDWPRYQQNPSAILKIWEGGLASHGGTIGVLLSVMLYMRFIRERFPELRLLTLLDNIALPTALVATFIRIGNFFNQEIIGTQSDLPWAINFGHPWDDSGLFPRHPAQLYEAASYLLTFFVLGYLWIQKRERLKTGYLTGLFFVMVFTSRFFVEFFKVSQGGVLDDLHLQTGQILSIPFIALGWWLMVRRSPYQTSRAN